MLEQEIKGVDKSYLIKSAVDHEKLPVSHEAQAHARRQVPSLRQFEPCNYAKKITSSKFHFIKMEIIYTSKVGVLKVVIVCTVQFTPYLIDRINDLYSNMNSFPFLCSSSDFRLSMILLLRLPFQVQIGFCMEQSATQLLTTLRVSELSQLPKQHFYMIRYSFHIWSNLSRLDYYGVTVPYFLTSMQENRSLLHY